MSIHSFKNARFTVTGPKQARFYFSTDRNCYKFTFDVQCGADNMETYQLLSASRHNDYRDTICRQNDSGTTLIFKYHPMYNREVDRIFRPIWSRYLKGRPFASAEFFI